MAAESPEKTSEERAQDRVRFYAPICGRCAARVQPCGCPEQGERRMGFMGASGRKSGSDGHG